MTRVGAEKFDEVFTDRMSRVIQVDSTFDLVSLLGHCERVVMGFSLLTNPDKQAEPNEGSNEVMEQLHAGLKRDNHFYYYESDEKIHPGEIIIRNESLTSFLKVLFS